MNDDREVSCYALLLDAPGRQGRARRGAAPPGWRSAMPTTAARCWPPRCSTPSSSRQPTLWRKARLAIDANRPRAARQAVVLISAGAGQPAWLELIDNPARYLAAQRRSARAAAERRTGHAGADAPGRQRPRGRRRRSSTSAGTARCPPTWPRGPGPRWRKQAALKLLPDAPDHFQRAALRGRQGRPRARLARRHAGLEGARRAARRRRPRPLAAGDAGHQRDERRPSSATRPGCTGRRARCRRWPSDSQDGEAHARAGAELLEQHRRPVHFYGKLAAEDLGQPVVLPAAPAAADAPKSARPPRSHPGLTRALQLIALGLRNEGVREWNFSLRGMDDRELLAAAQLACDREVWDRCINTSDRTRGEIDIDAALPDAVPHARCRRARANRPRPGLRLRADPPGVALRHGRALRRRRLRPDAADAGHRALDGARRSAWTTRPT